MIRKLLLSSVAIAAGLTTAQAADLPSRRAPPVYVPPVVGYSWTGFYIGGQVGYAFGRDNAREVANNGAGPDVLYQVGFPNGTIGGAHIGYNFSTQSLPVLGQFAGAFSGIPLIGGVGGAGGVVGVEGDVDGTDYRGQVSFPGAGAGANFFNQVKQNITGSVRGRIGIAVDRALFFATGGVAFGQFTENYGFGTTAGAGGSALTDSLTTTRVGFTVGGGIEYALTTNFSLRGEYRYTQYGKFVDINSPATGAFNTQHHEYQNRVQVGFSYKFDGFSRAPVVARY